MEQLEAGLKEDFLAGIADLVTISRDNREAMHTTRRAVIEKYVPDLLPAEEAMRAQAEVDLAALDEMSRTGDITGYLARLREAFQPVTEMGLPFQVISRALVELLGPASAVVRESFADDPARSRRAIDALHLLEREVLIIAGEAYARAREDHVGSEYSETIRRLSTPVIQVWDDVLVMPLVGVLDSGRAQQMMEQLLERVVALQARTVILDITGVPTVDTAVAQHLLRTTKASRLVGATTTVVGISPQVAQTLVRLGVALDDIDTFIDLRSGLEHALGALGYSVMRTA